jgi:hypothetical protein
MKYAKFLGILVSFIGLFMFMNALGELGFTVNPEPRLGPVLGRGGFAVNRFWWEKHSFRALSGFYFLIVGFGLFGKKKWAYHPSALFFIPLSAYLTKRTINYLINLHGTYSVKDYLFIVIVIVVWCFSLLLFKRHTPVPNEVEKG